MDYSYYESKSNEVFSIIKTFAERVEQVSIDEFFIDVSERVSNDSNALEYARSIKEAIATKAKLPCSIGISETKLIAKMACEKAKPSGIKLVSGADAKSFIAKMKLGEMYGIGSKTEERLNALGYNTAEELAKASIMALMENFGSFGIELHNMANAIDESEVVEAGDAKSISREHTFESDTSNNTEISSSIKRLAAELGAEIESKKISFRTVNIKLRYSDFSESLHGRTIRQTNKPAQIAETALSLFKENFDGKRKLRKLGVRVSGLTSYKSQKSLF
jgi:DNA polymerase IV (DinB-like DNA polymerase)